MDDKQKYDFRSCIALCDQAIAPLVQLTRTLNGLVPAEIKQAQDSADDAKIDKMAAIKHQVGQLQSAVETLEQLKVGIEKYK